MIESLLDLILAAAVVWLAWMSLASHDLFRSVVLYIVFGLVMALAWVRLQAPDIALAEAAIGAGLTGALLLDAASQFGSAGTGADAARPRRAGAVLAALAVAGFGGVFALAVHALPREAGGLTGLVAENMEFSGVGHPATAVLLNFRAFDTWMEVAVLLVAVLATLIVRRSPDFRDVPALPALDPVLAGLPRVIVPVMILAGGYLLWLGTHAPGGAFQSGAVLASAAVLLLLTGRRGVVALGGAGLRAVLLAGVLAFLIVGVGTLAAGGALLQFPTAYAGPLILGIETAVTVSIAATLALMFAGARVPAAPAAGGTEDGR